jgi:hypothetical protein
MDTGTFSPARPGLLALEPLEHLHVSLHAGARHLEALGQPADHGISATDAG